LPEGLRFRLEQECAALQFVEQQIQALEARRRQILRTSDDPDVQKVRRLLELRGIGENIARPLVMELFGWREFRNRR